MKKGILERIFNLKGLETDLKTEIIAGFATFMTMAYIIFVNPNILKAAGIPFESVMFATCISSAVATLIMGLYANYPIALAPGMGMNAYYTYVVCLKMGITWQVALGAVFISGVVFALLAVSRIREMIINAIPPPIKYGTAAGIGLFIAFIGLQNAGIVVPHRVTFVTVGDLKALTTLLAIFGIFFTAILLSLKVKGAILLGILATTAISILFGETKVPDEVVRFPGSREVSAFLEADIYGALKLGLLNVIFVFLFVDMFDTAGTLVGVCSQAGFLDDRGRLPRANQALLADAAGTIVGSLLGTSTVTSYIESAAGVAEGGRSGLTACVVAILFLLSVFLSPIAGIIPQCATAPALIIVGSFMLSGITRIDWDAPGDAIPAFLTIIAMPLTYSIANGLAMGFVSYPIIKLLSGKGREVHWLVYVLACLFLLRYALL
jgi:AGZA family xanthine/uracil permease-like MFS transporter